MLSDPRHITEHSRQIMINQLVMCALPDGLTAREYRTILEEANHAEVAEVWRHNLGDLCERMGV